MKLVMLQIEAKAPTMKIMTTTPPMKTMAELNADNEFDEEIV